MEFLRSIMLDFYIVIGITLTFDFCLITVQPLFKKKYILCNSCVIEKEHSNSDINDLFKLLILKQTQCSRLKLSVLFVMKWDVILRRMIVNSEIVSFFIANQSSLDKKIVISFYKNIITNLIIRMAFNRPATFDW